jgi:four helix bundle protein
MDHIKYNHTSPEFGSDIPIFTKLYDFYKNLSQILTLFPKAKRYTLGQKIDNLTLEIFESSIAAGISSSEKKLPHLEKAIISLDLLKILLRLAKDIQCLDNKKYLQLQESLQEIGRMLGGWKRSVK